MKKVSVVFFALAIFFVGFVFAEEVFTLEQPAFITSAGQSPGALQMTVVCKMVKLDYTFEKLMTADDFDPQAYNCAIFVVGASGKGLGAAGIDIDEETARVVALAQKAKDNGLPIVLTHLEGAARRGASSDLLFNELSPFADALFIKEESDAADQMFSNIAEEKEIPIFFFEKTADLKNVISEVFGL
ncbi:MAG: hypothetical protein PWQ77_214 [Kosmotogales bacterium]|nr:hypothetical protein [Kosmotogales bacterium]